MIGDYICIFNIELHIPNNNISMKTIQQKFTLIDKQKVDGNSKLMIAKCMLLSQDMQYAIFTDCGRIKAAMLLHLWKLSD